MESNKSYLREDANGTNLLSDLLDHGDGTSDEGCAGISDGSAATGASVDRAHGEAVDLVPVCS